MLNTAYLSLGSNIENRLNYLNNAIELLKLRQIEVNKISSVYETSAWGYENQNSFLNIAVEIKTPLQANSLLEVILQTEKEMGRKREKKWAERIIDIDIVLFNEAIIDESYLIVPHPEMHNRKFVLIPLMEINSQIVHPLFKKNISELNRICIDKGDVKLFSKSFF